MLANESSEGRASDRHLACSAVRVLRHPDLKRAPIEGWLRDLSTGGMGMSLRAALPIGEEVIVELRDADHHTKLRLPAEVRWCQTLTDDEHLAGFQFFQELSDKQLLVIQSSLAETLNAIWE